MKYKIIVLVVLLIQTLHLRAQDKPLNLYLLIGQSNMAGRGAVEPQDTIAFPRVFTLNKNNKWVPARDPIHFDKSVAGVGLGRTFGIEMAKANPNAVVGLIPCAVGGSSIDVWKPGIYFRQTKTNPWDDMEKRLEIALQHGKLKGILWHQGESDSNPAQCDSYKQKLEDLIQRVRSLAGNPNVPFVAGELGRFKIKSNKEQYSNMKPSPAQVVMKSTQEVVNSDKNAAFVNSHGLHHRGDQTHFN